jgi:uncharacterized protein
MNKQEIIKRVTKRVMRELGDEGSGHDWWHTYRVWKMAKRIAKEESASEAVKE